MQFTVRAPASSANLGPGFDTLGLALNVHDELVVEATDAGVEIDVEGVGAGEVPTDATHLVARAALHTFERLGVDAPGAGNDAHHDLAVTRRYWAALPQRVRDHLVCPVVDELAPIVQKHDIEGLVMG